MKSILIIIPYFGKFNNYFNLFLKSVEYNDTVDFLIITDDKREFNYPKNVKVIYSTFLEEAKRMTSYFDFEAKCDNPYKICDYRPFLGEIYKEYSKDYDFWGWCDTDIIFGDIREFVTSDLLKFCDKLYVHGHFSLIKNDGYVNQLLLNSPIYEDIWHCSEAFCIGDKTVQYDEYNGCLKTLYRLGAKIYFHIEDIANIDFRYHPFYLCKWDIDLKELIDEKLIFSFQRGKLVGISEKSIQKEFLYVHLQKREMENKVANLESFYIIPNSFIDFDPNFSHEEEFFKQKELSDLEDSCYTYISKKLNTNIVYYQPKQEVLQLLREQNKN